jgi:hypothetical protein
LRGAVSFVSRGERGNFLISHEFFWDYLQKNSKGTLLPLYCSEYPVYTCQMGEGVLALAQHPERR